MSRPRDFLALLSPVDYALAVDFYDLDFSFDVATLIVGVIPFTVTGVAPADSVPSSDRRGLLALSLLVSVMAVGALHFRRRRAWAIGLAKLPES